MKRNIAKLTLDRTVTYQIKVPGVIDVSLADWAAEMDISVEREGEDAPITTLTGELDQAALHGLLRRLYSMGLPLQSVSWIRGDVDELEGS